jgi:hypothetical protein
MLANDLQLRTLRLYGELLARNESWSGKLIFACGEAAASTGLPTAVSIAGGVTLVLDPNAAAVKSVFRHGGLDFLVNTLDEALRVLKNELRKQKPLSVALTAPIQPTLSEMRERGILPDLTVDINLGLSNDNPSQGPNFNRPLDNSSKGHGFSRAIDGPSKQGALAPGVAAGSKIESLSHLHLTGTEPTPTLTEWLHARRWQESTLASTAKALSLFAPDDPRRRWLERLPNYQRLARNTPLPVWLTQEEQMLLQQPAAT